MTGSIWEGRGRPAVHGVVRNEHLLCVADAEERDQRGDTQLVRKEDLEAEAVERKKGSLVENAGVVSEVGAVVGVADCEPVGLHAFGEEDLELLVAERAVVGVGDDRHAGCLLRSRGGS